MLLTYIKLKVNTFWFVHLKTPVSSKITSGTLQVLSRLQKERPLQ